jgi:methylated-DNA-[protein]-cysteine S-methyltransferase
LQPDGTDFQKAVWRELMTILYGQTVSYQDVAHAIGKPQAVRAVGAANGQNPVSIIIPCHRVIGSNGKLTGYGGGLWRKEWLLNHEGHVAGRQMRLF